MSLPSSPSLLAFASVLGRSGRENHILHPAIDLALRLFRVLPGAVAALAHQVLTGTQQKKRIRKLCRIEIAQVESRLPK